MTRRATKSGKSVKSGKSAKSAKTPSTKSATARARSNIALAKYWGKSDTKLNIPAVPSISMTLHALTTTTEVTFRPGLSRDQAVLDGRRLAGRELARVVAVLRRVRAQAGLRMSADVRSENSFPTAAGLASSASGFAALVTAASAAAGLSPTPRALSSEARRASASAARSIFGGYVELPAGKPGQAALAAKPLLPADHWDLRLVIAVTARGPKAVGSTEAMERSRRTSPAYAAWLTEAPKLARRVRAGLRARDLDLLGQAMERSTLSFHACAMAAAPPVLYMQPPTVAALRAVWALRERGLPVYATMDAGPHVKALCHAADAARVRRALAKVDGVLSAQVARPGPGVELL